MTGLPHGHLADELMLMACETEPWREDTERDRLIAAAAVQATLALVDEVTALRETLTHLDAGAPVSWLYPVADPAQTRLREGLRRRRAVPRPPSTAEQEGRAVSG